MKAHQDELLLRAFAAEVKRRRGEIEMSQDSLAYEANLSRSFIAKLERAQTSPSLTTLFNLAQALSIEPDELMLSLKKRYRREVASAKTRIGS